MSEEKPTKKKKPTAEKRMIQNEKRRAQNQVFKSRVRTAIRVYEQSASEKENQESLTEKLSAVYKLMDKGVKKGVFKPNKAARFKSKYAARLQK